MRCLLLLLFFWMPGYGQAQLPAVPESRVLQNRESYTSYAGIAKAVSIALFTLPLREEPEWRRQAAAFLHQWLEGNPRVKSNVTSLILRLEERNPGMRLLFEAGCIRHALAGEEPVAPQQQTAVVLGWMMRYYEAQPGLRRDKIMKSMIRARDEGRLDAWIGKEMGMED